MYHVSAIMTHGAFSICRQNTRDRLKLLPRIVNVDEWGEKAPLSGPELRLIRNYNGKPLLMRPQQRFYLGSDRQYFEIDVDIHRYAYIARRAFYGYIPKLKPAIFENAFVVQGGHLDENGTIHSLEYVC